MELERAILERRAVREYQSKEISLDILQKILNAGAMAPSARDAQPCRFIVISSRSKILELSEKVKQLVLAKGIPSKLAERAKTMQDPVFYSAAVLVLIVAEKTTQWTAMDCALAAQNMMLRAFDLGLGSCFIGYANLLNEDRETLRDLGVQDSQELFCPLVLGYPKQWPSLKTRKPIVQKIIK